MPPFIDIAGKKFNRLTVVQRTGTSKHGQPIWLCRCDCGADKYVPGQALREGNVKSCGCYNDEVRSAACKARNTTHGMASAPEYHTWINIRQRCHNKSSKGFSKYGARGISVCKRWRDSFDAFYADMGPRPSEKHTIDRINGRKNYQPDNCRWATQREQQNNRSNNHVVQAFGESHTLMEWSRITGLNRSTIQQRLVKLGWPPEIALSKRT